MTQDDYSKFSDVVGDVARQLTESNGYIHVKVDGRMRRLLWDKLAWKLRELGWIVEYKDKGIESDPNSGPTLLVRHPHTESIVPLL